MNIVVKQNVFSPDLTNLLRPMLLQESLFVPATVTGDASWRSGRVAHINGTPQSAAVAAAILNVVPEVAAELGYLVNPPTPTICEVQMSSYGGGDYFKTHNDNGTPDVTDRWLSWVHYIYPEPEPRLWMGGQLVIHDVAETITYEPADGETVFFPSSILHEILPVAAPPGWANRRFTVNGWVKSDAWLK